MSLIIDPNLPEKELREALREWCNNHSPEECEECQFFDNKDAWCEHYGSTSIPTAKLTETIKEINNPNEDNSDANNEVTNEVTEPQYDIVSHPKHYNREGALECYEEMELVFSVDELMTWCKVNAWKYRYRALYKNGEEDMKKSDECIKKLKELRERESNKLPF